VLFLGALALVACKTDVVGGGGTGGEAGGGGLPDAGCGSACAGPCGDGVVDPGEACDDGNVVGGDGCSSACALEPTPASGVALFAGNEGANSISRFELPSGASSTFFTGTPGSMPPPWPFTMTGLAVSADASTLYFASQAAYPSGDLKLYSVPTTGGTPTLFDDTAPDGGPLQAFALAVGPDQALHALLIHPTRIVRYDGGGASEVVVHDTDTMTQTLGFAISPSGELFYSDHDERTVRRVTGVATSEVYADASDGLETPLGLAFDAAGRLYVADAQAGALRRFTAPHQGAVIAGEAEGLFAPNSVTVDAATGEIYVANVCWDQGSTIVRLDPSGAPSPFGDPTDGLICTRSLALLHP